MSVAQSFLQSVVLHPYSMDSELLIAEVFERKPIWQSRHKLHHNRGIIEQEWERVAVAVNTTKESARARWKSLKDQYRKEVKKMTKSSSGDKGEKLQTSTWPYFTSLDFLIDEINLVTRTSNLKQNPKSVAETDYKTEYQETTKMSEQVTTCNNIGLNDDSLSNETEAEILARHTPVENCDRSQTPSLQTIRKRKETSQETVEKNVNFGKRKIAHLEDDRRCTHEDCEDYHFLMSLLPHLQSLEPLQKLRVRNNMIQVLIDEATGDPTRTLHSGFSAHNYSNYQSPETNHGYILDENKN